MKRNFSIFICIVIGFLGFSEELEQKLDSLLPAPIIKELVETGKIQKSAYKDKNAKITLLPSLDIAKRIISLVNPRTYFFVENLYLYEKPDSSDINVDTEKISNILRSLSTLEGIEYFSTTNQNNQILYEKSYSIVSKDDKTKKADNLEDKTNGLRVFALQHDSLFGENIYQYDYSLSENTVSLQSTNYEPLKISFLTVINTGNLQASLIVHDMNTHLLIYAFTQAKFIYLPGLEGRVNSAFSTRAEALYNWFISAYEN